MIKYFLDNPGMILSLLGIILGLASLTRGIMAYKRRLVEKKEGNVFEKNPIATIIISAIITIGIILTITFITLATTDEPWHHEEIAISSLHKYSTGKSQTIAFIDTGISDELLEHCRDKIVSIYNVIDDSDMVRDENGHGTQMASISCLGIINEKITGIAKDSNVIIIKAVDDDGKTKNEYLKKAIDYAIENEATVINISLGGFKGDDDVIKSIENAIAKEITVVAAAGDYGNKDLLFPASVSGVISVEASTQNNKVWKKSNTSENSVSTFPGDGIIATGLSNEQVYVIGTSASASIASAYIALLKDYAKSLSIELSNDAIIELLYENIRLKNEKIDYLEPFKQVKDQEK